MTSFAKTKKESFWHHSKNIFPLGWRCFYFWLMRVHHRRDHQSHLDVSHDSGSWCSGMNWKLAQKLLLFLLLACEKWTRIFMRWSTWCFHHQHPHRHPAHHFRHHQEWSHFKIWKLLLLVILFFPPSFFRPLIIISSVCILLTSCVLCWNWCSPLQHLMFFLLEKKNPLAVFLLISLTQDLLVFQTRAEAQHEIPTFDSQVESRGTLQLESSGYMFYGNQPRMELMISHLYIMSCMQGLSKWYLGISRMLPYTCLILEEERRAPNKRQLATFSCLYGWFLPSFIASLKFSPLLQVCCT